jgi:uncharacterized protein YegL
MDLNQFVTNLKRPLPVFLLLDSSGSMGGEKVNALNTAVKQMVADFKGEKLSEVALQLSIITFGGAAKIVTELVDINEFQFTPISANGGTPLGAALDLLSTIINNKEKVTSKGYKPTIVLVSDGQPNDVGWEAKLESFVSGARTGKCERWSLAIGSDADKLMLKRFINNPLDKVVEADGNEASTKIVDFFKLVTMTTTARAKSVNPNQSLKIEELKQNIQAEMPKFDFDIE